MPLLSSEYSFDMCCLSAADRQNKVPPKQLFRGEFLRAYFLAEVDKQTMVHGTKI
jgi:hypothetical protein